MQGHLSAFKMFSIENALMKTTQYSDKAGLRSGKISVEMSDSSPKQAFMPEITVGAHAL